MNKPKKPSKLIHKQAAPFKATRKHHSTEAAEDYTELVAELIIEKGVARTCDIARRLGISHVTALRTIKRLVEEGFLSTSPHQPVTLTLKGARLAKESKDRHDTLIEFFTRLGVPSAIADIDVEGAEHHISSVTLSKIKEFLVSNKSYSSCHKD